MQKYKIKPIDMTEIIMLADKGMRIDVYDLIRQAEQLYIGVKAVGIEKIDVCYYSNEDKIQATTLKGIQLSEKVRAVACLTTRLMKRFPYNDSGRLERRYGLTADMADYLLSGIKGYNRTRYGITIDEMMVVADIIDALAV